MNFTSKASITVTGTASAAEVLAAARALPGLDAAVLDAAQRASEATKSAAGLTLVARNASFAEDGSATVELVYERVEAAAPADAGQGAPVVAQQAAQNAAQPLAPADGLEIPAGLTAAA